MDIQNTTDYGQFVLLNANRNVKRTHLNKLIESIQERDMLAEHPIKVNSRMEVLDGQHRLKAAEALGIPVYYYISDDDSLASIRLLNVNQLSWTYKDYINFYCEQGDSNYITLRAFMEETKFPVGVSLQLLGTKDGRRPSGDVNGFKNGKITILDEERAYILASYMREVEKYTEGPVILDRDFVIAFCFVLTKFKQSAIINKLRRYPYAFHMRPNLTDYLRAFEDLMNYGSHKRVVLSMTES